jgi:hypothetical protein
MFITPMERPSLTVNDFTQFRNGSFTSETTFAIRGYNRGVETAGRRGRNWPLWVGFGTTLLATFSYIPFFVKFPATRDFPWANLLLFAAAGCLLAIGLYRAFAQPVRYRGKISGVIFSALSLAVFGLFCAGAFYFARNIPRAETAPRVGQRAPEFTLTGLDGKPVTLSQLRQGNRYVLLIFYRGYW